MKRKIAGITTVLLGALFLSGTAWAQCQGAEKAEKAVVAEVGKSGPGLYAERRRRERGNPLLIQGKTVVLEWFNPGCPFVKRVHLENGPMPAMVKKHVDGGGVWLAINSGAPGKQGTGMEANQKALKDYGISWPLLLDESGKVGRSYAAVKTPHVYVINGEGTLVYAGGVDSTNGGGYGEGDYTNHLQAALDEVKAGESGDNRFHESVGLLGQIRRLIQLWWRYRRAWQARLVRPVPLPPDHLHRAVRYPLLQEACQGGNRPIYPRSMKRVGHNGHLDIRQFPVVSGAFTKIGSRMRSSWSASL